MEHEREYRKGAGLGFVLAVYAASRLFYLISGSILARVVPTSGFQRVTQDVPPGSMNVWSHWDGEHYVMLAASGYLTPPENVSPAFFPLYPLLVRSFAELFGGPLSNEALSLLATLISLICLPFALYFLYHIALNEWGERVARGSVLCLAFFPTAFFLNSAYTESLFLMLSAGSVWAMRVRKELLLACVLAGFASATRNVGVFLVVPIVLEWIKEGGVQRRGERWRVVYLALVPSGLMVYMGYLWARFGDPFLFYSAQQDWGRRATGPLATAGGAWASAVEGAGGLLDPDLWADPNLGNLANHLAGAGNFFNLVFFVLAVFVLVAGSRDLPPSLTLYGLLLIAPATLFGTPGSPLMGTPRYVLVAFPIFIVLGLLSRNRLLFGGWLVFSTLASLLLCGLFVSWRFVA
ncbi:FIG00761799: membrane protein [uncultured Rubrobacteraceae bacterium]|uniref:FIG00761799: membrane protein n=1 Tax=uncultured Rubrobacteraceae bacterium TaxID=349277 RepID=A0A6J4QH79_9ACTN|nr:FIG00761799: membrane protein [uncultured Rubrobacteraceae bacterium]